jgi:hypothetical protein
LAGWEPSTARIENFISPIYFLTPDVWEIVRSEKARAFTHFTSCLLAPVKVMGEQIEDYVVLPLRSC